MNSGASGSAPGSAFPTTQWSMVLHAGSGADTRAQTALEQLCRQYWYPLYVFVRREGRTHHEAEDCTQEFLARLLAADGIARARQEQGRFRSFLLGGIRHFLINEWHRSRTAKRGGGQAPLPLQLQDAEGRFASEPADPGLTPEQAFDRNWALGLIDQTVDELRVEYEKSGRGAIFAALQPHLWGAPPAAGQAASATQSGLSAHAFTVALQRARQRLGVRLRLRVAETVAEDADIDTELRHLIAAINGGTAGAPSPAAG
jgi:DNA-directed RNA polymerase specialized sigma24 family protein